MRYYVLIKRRGSKRWLGAIPSRAGVSLARLRKVVKRVTKPGYQAKIVTQAMFKRLMGTLVRRKKKMQGSRGKARKSSRQTKRRKVTRRYKGRTKRRRK